MKKFVNYARTHAKSIVSGVVSLVTFLISHNLLDLSGDKSAVIASACTWIMTHIVPNLPEDPPEPPAA